MTTTYDETGFGQSSPSARRISSFLRSVRDTFQERRQRLILRATLSNLSDRELMDIGTTRGEIDYVASNRISDPRGIISG
jgi:uncharacterized protein YjiS (DUF1127 family)